SLQRGAIEFAQQNLNEELDVHEKEAAFNLEGWKKCADFGIQGLVMPTRYGGSGLDVLTVMHVLEGLGYGCQDNGLLFALGAQIWAVQTPINTFGSEALKARYLPALIRGDIVGAHAATEPESGSDIF